MTLQDLANYRAIEREPLSINYKNTKIFSTVAPSSGSVVLSALKVGKLCISIPETKLIQLRRSLKVTPELPSFRDKWASTSLPIT
jgi:hypothetical protein